MDQYPGLNKNLPQPPYINNRLIEQLNDLEFIC